MYTIRFVPVAHDGVTADCIPTAATDGSAGYDLCAAVAAPVVIAPGEIVRIPSGVRVIFPDYTHFGMVASRSGLAAKFGIALVNGIGVIDPDYTGELIMCLINHSVEPYTINPGNRISQIIFMPFIKPHTEITQIYEETKRGDGGYGSTGN
ncbi:deoxyuridine 5'-triphosphate nucleotidohydrolase [Clostridia bacterium]|nr:deoxyuridine 5'-triphosphate nucleotidohydrolase [Clostridia bacterium]